MIRKRYHKYLIYISFSGRINGDLVYIFVMSYNSYYIFGRLQLMFYPETRFRFLIKCVFLLGCAVLYQETGKLRQSAYKR